MADVEVRITSQAAIGEDPNTLEYLVQQLRQAPRFDRIVVRINNAGGNPQEAVAMFHELRRHGVKVTTIVEGMAFSAASLLFMAGDERLMNRGAMLMIHQPSIAIRGTASELNQAARQLRKIRGEVSGIYASHSKNSEKSVRRMLSTDSYMTADEAVSNGFATGVLEAPAIAACVDLSQFRDVPEAALSLVSAAESKEERPVMANSNTPETPVVNPESGTTPEVTQPVTSAVEKPEAPTHVTMTIEEYEAFKSKNVAPEPTPVVPEVSPAMSSDDRLIDVRLAERSRVSAITTICQMARVPDAQVQQYIDGDKTVSEVSMELRSQAVQNTPPVPNAPGTEQDENEKYRKEYRDAVSSGVRMSTDEDSFIQSRRVSDGKELLGVLG
ncbi:ATP-dependent Clp protease proteolytic subunit 1 [Thalassoglobus neptunius]|uniref:ATP-dependent Clp protease proteolytic subunit n=1 Tax=Thalassoglobus neptunius TaxID=1938619 RepID=A0A5C5X2J0_9PLAN|nr:head maturation protease, ClpP-related [Thalassoglobus neptunius]TWT57247.1 ATP-dependent Clp protease proteolytic subunit 1 [Thalassoglobus neptunius]